MRYRPFGASGKAVSAVSLLLRDAPNMGSPSAWRSLIISAMESGVNSFEATAGSDVLAMGLGEALSVVERRLIFLGWRLRGNPAGAVTGRDIADSVRAALQRTRAGYLDLLMLDETAAETMTPDALTYLADLRNAGVCLQIGVVGEGPVIDKCIANDAFDVLATGFSLVSDWQTRRRIRDASAANMTLIGCDPFPSGLQSGPSSRAEIERPMRRGLLGGRRQDPTPSSNTYGFLHDTPGWSCEELCLAFALTEPAFATIQLEAGRADMIERMSTVTDKDLPTGVAAQIEMARFGQIAAQRRA
ncbi:aldo/keto reductase [Phenylobacterium sp.]|uniref:aldo/keto reductase n=1 Tax=Phenylobacterium sp. TaxID=1871053 RepID=UPI0025FCAEDD|nr:aldo/keto reductase [Phenylobacterium sp.]